MDKGQLIPHLFRTEYGKIVAVLCKNYGIELLAMAEDIASDTFQKALETWPYSGVPDNPSAWLFTVAKNKASTLLKRKQTFTQNVVPNLAESPIHLTNLEVNEQIIQDSQLQMLFAVCHPSISADAQLALALRILCGFGIDEIASALLSNKEAINKKLFRAKEKFRVGQVQLEMPPESEIDSRLEIVLRVIYLLFNEGYYSETGDQIVRKDLCLEAMRLCYLLLENTQTSIHSSLSLMALMCFHSSRLEARTDLKGSIILYEDQNKNLWNTELIEKGFHYLQRASQWEISSKYYLEASIAYWHTVKGHENEKWPAILKLYDALIHIDNSPSASLNRIYALYKVKGSDAAFAEIKDLKIQPSPYYHILMARLFEANPVESREHLKIAQKLSKSSAEREFLQKRIEISEQQFPTHS